MNKSFKNEAVLSLAYLAPIQFFSKYFLYDKVYIEQFENYNKQSYRNRCEIYTANGKLVLNIPIIKGRTPKQDYKKVKISYDENWQKNHIRAIEAAYRHSPFFEFYWDEFLPFFQQKVEFLWDFNLNLHRLCLKNIGLNFHVDLSHSYRQNEEYIDLYHFLIRAKGNRLPDIHCAEVPYYQVFSDKDGFLPNLSILDLLFNEGPNSSTILSKMAIKNSTE